MNRRRFLEISALGIAGGMIQVPVVVSAEAEEFAPTMTPRSEWNLNTNWHFLEGPQALEQLPPTSDPRWQVLNVPHDYSIAKPYDQQNPVGASGGFLGVGIGWYSKRLEIPASWAGKKLRLEFDGCMANSKVWVNGRLVGERPNGYVGLHYDITPHVQPGETNTVIVMTDTSHQPASRWYSGSGIYRDVRLVVTHPVHVEHGGISIHSENVSEKSAEVIIETEVVNATQADENVTVSTSILSPAGEIVARGEASLTLAASQRGISTQRFTIEQTSLWSDDSPQLYRAETILQDGKTLFDTTATAFGIREAVFDADRGFFINGQSKKLKGVCLHHDLGPLGAAVNDHILRARLLELKAMGCNAVRCAHSTFSPSFYKLCDTLGLYVIDEFFDEWQEGKRAFTYHRFFDEWWERDLDDIIRQNRNHPSIVLWSIGNEIHEKNKPAGVAVCTMLRDRVHALDSTRPVTAGVNGIDGANRSGFAEVLDVVGYNGGGDSVFKYDQDHEKYPERKMYASEVPHTFSTRGVYQTGTRYRDEGKPQCKRMMKVDVPDLAEREVFPDVPAAYYSSYDNALVRINAQASWKLIEDRDFMAGEFRWTGFDYLGESHGWPAKSSNAGVLDLCGFRKDPFYLYQAMWREEPVLHILPHWTWPGKEGVRIPVCAFTNCDEVELWQDGEPRGRKRRGERYDVLWDVPYRPGEIRAVGYSDGQAVCEASHRTASAPHAIVLEPDKTDLLADACDVCRLIVRIVDAEGAFVPTAGNLLRFEVEGDAAVLAVGNGDPASDESSKATRRSAFNGLCLAVIQSKRSAGEARVKVSSPDLNSATITLSLRPNPFQDYL